MEKEGNELDKVLEALDRALTDATNPPPAFEELAEAAASAPSGVDDAFVTQAQRQLRSRLLGQKSVGELVRRRREVLGLDVEVLARRAAWSPDELESLERDELDLHRVEPESLGVLLFRLRIKAVGPIEDALQRLAVKHLATYEGSAGAVYGRSRRGVTGYDRRNGLTAGVRSVDIGATMRAAERFVRDVDTKLRELSAEQDASSH